MGLPNGRTILGGLLMTLAAIGAFLLATGSDAGDAVDVVVAARDLRAGDVLDAGDLRMVSITLDGEIGGLFGRAEAAVGRRMVGATDEGEFLLESATVDGGDEPAGTFEMILALPHNRVPGVLTAGESVDVFATWNGDVTELIAVDATVIDAHTAGDDLIGRSETVIRLEVTDLAQLEAVVHAHAAGDVTLARTPDDSGATVGREYQPGTVASDTIEDEDG